MTEVLLGNSVQFPAVPVDLGPSESSPCFQFLPCNISYSDFEPSEIESSCNTLNGSCLA